MLDDAMSNRFQSKLSLFHPILSWRGNLRQPQAANIFLEHLNSRASRDAVSSHSYFLFCKCDYLKNKLRVRALPGR